MNAIELFVASVVVAGLFGVGVAVVVTRVGNKNVAELRRRGLYPEEGKAREEDVVRLLKAGQKIMAIRCYRELHQGGLKEAKDAVEVLEKQNA